MSASVNYLTVNLIFRKKKKEKENFKNILWLSWKCFSSVQSLSHVQLFVTPWTPAHHASLSITNSWSLLKLMFMESVMPSNHLILCHPLLLLPSIFPSIRVFSNKSAFSHQVAKVLSFSFSINPSNGYLGLIFFRIDWFKFPCGPRNPQESSPTPQFESINS